MSKADILAISFVGALGALAAIEMVTGDAEAQTERTVSRTYIRENVEVRQVIGNKTDDGTWRIHVCARLNDTDGGLIPILHPCVECSTDTFTLAAIRTACGPVWLGVNGL